MLRRLAIAFATAMFLTMCGPLAAAAERLPPIEGVYMTFGACERLEDAKAMYESPTEVEAIAAYTSNKRCHEFPFPVDMTVHGIVDQVSGFLGHTIIMDVTVPSFFGDQHLYWGSAGEERENVLKYFQGQPI